MEKTLFVLLMFSNGDGNGDPVVADHVPVYPTGGVFRADRFAAFV
jgi:hypothetical protein